MKKKENLKALKDDTEEVERMLKALIKSLVYKRLNKRLDPGPLESSNPVLQLNWRRTFFKNGPYSANRYELGLF